MNLVAYEWIQRNYNICNCLFWFSCRWLPVWRLAKMYRHYFQMWSTACKRITWSWKSWFICIWWTMPNRNRIWLLWPLIHSLRFVDLVSFFLVFHSMTFGDGQVCFIVKCHWLSILLPIHGVIYYIYFFFIYFHCSKQFLPHSESLSSLHQMKFSLCFSSNEQTDSFIRDNKI